MTISLNNRWLAHELKADAHKAPKSQNLAGKIAWHLGFLAAHDRLMKNVFKPEFLKNGRMDASTLEQPGQAMKEFLNGHRTAALAFADKLNETKETREYRWMYDGSIGREAMKVVETLLPGAESVLRAGHPTPANAARFIAGFFVVGSGQLYEIMVLQMAGEQGVQKVIENEIALKREVGALPGKIQEWVEEYGHSINEEAGNG